MTIPERKEKNSLNKVLAINDSQCACDNFMFFPIQSAFFLFEENIKFSLKLG